jgi:hypothetical protein
MATENKLEVTRLAMPEITRTFPESSRLLETDPKTITIRVWSTAQYKDALEAGGKSFNDDLLQRVTLSLDGAPVDQATDFMEKWSPKIVQLAYGMINDIGVPKDDEIEAFRASSVTKLK